MKFISPIKSLTAVGFLLVSLSSGRLWAECTERIVDGKRIDLKTKCSQIFSLDSQAVSLAKCSEIYSCLELEKENLVAEKQDKKEAKTSCASAMKDYNKVIGEANNACRSLDKTENSSKDSCEGRIQSCREKMESAYGTSSGAGNMDLFNSMMGIYVQQQYPNANPNDFPVDGGTTGKSCVRYSSKEDKKEKKNEEKERQRDIQKLTEKIQEEEKEKTKKNAELREKNVDIDSDLQKVDEAVKKAIRSVDEKKGERLRKLNEDLAKSAIAIRKRNEEIILEKEKVERIKFENAQKMMQFTKDKISTQCQTAIDTAKQCFIRSSKGQISNDPQDPCRGLSITAKGAKGTAQLKAKVAKVKEACFEQANMTLNKNKFDIAATIRTSEMALLNKNNEITDAKNDIERRQNDYASISAESDKEKTDEEKTAEKQIDNLKTKLERLTTSTQQALLDSDKKIAQLNEDILKARQKAFLEKSNLTDEGKLDTDILDNATRAVDEKEAERSSAVAACCPEGTDPDKVHLNEDVAKFTGVCKKLILGGSKQVEGKKRKSTSGEARK